MDDDDSIRYKEVQAPKSRSEIWKKERSAIDLFGTTMRSIAIQVSG
jgi:hypothetical protein